MFSTRLTPYLSHLSVLFQSFDVDGNGFIEEDEFMQMAMTLRESGGFGGNVLKGLAEADLNGDGMISFTEFVYMADRYDSL